VDNYICSYKTIFIVLLYQITMIKQLTRQKERANNAGLWNWIGIFLREIDDALQAKPHSTVATM
jgi:hypothetical protein